MFCSFYKERKRTRERFVLLKRTQENARTLRSFEKNGCPTLTVRGSKMFFEHRIVSAENK